MKVTKKELEFCKFIAKEADAFSLDDNYSWFNAKDAEEYLGWDIQVVGGVMSSLEKKGLIIDSGESTRKTHLTDFSGEPEMFLEFSELAHLVRNK